MDLATQPGSAGRGVSRTSHSAATGRDLLRTSFAPIAWGTTYVVTTELLPADRPMMTALLRSLPAGLILAAATRRRPQGSWWWKASVLGALNIGAFFALLFVAAYRLPGGVAATLGSVQPLVAGGLAALLVGERYRRTTAVAGLLGIVGVALLVLRAEAALDGIGVLAGLAGAISMATGVVLTKRWGRPVPLLAFTSWQLIAGGLMLIPIAVIAEGAPPSFTTANYLGYTWLATVGTAIAYALWFRGVSRLPVAQASLLGLLSPLVATLAGFVLLDQTLTPWQLVGAAVVGLAIWIGQRSPSTAETDDPASRHLNTPTPAVDHSQAPDLIGSVDGRRPPPGEARP
jgi:probable blue pigment (indigoidine) exporter